MNYIHTDITYLSTNSYVDEDVGSGRIAEHLKIFWECQMICGFYFFSTDIDSHGRGLIVWGFYQIRQTIWDRGELGDGLLRIYIYLFLIYYFSIIYIFSI